MLDLTPSAQDALRQLAKGEALTFNPWEGWAVKALNRLVELGYAEEFVNLHSKSTDLRMWKVTDAGKARAKQIPENIPSLKRSVPLWNGQ